MHVEDWYACINLTKHKNNSEYDTDTFKQWKKNSATYNFESPVFLCPFISAMNYMELVDRMGEKSEDWLVFKQVMKFLQSAGALFNSGLQRMTGQSA